MGVQSGEEWFPAGSSLEKPWTGWPLSVEMKAELACSRWQAGVASSRTWGTAQAMVRRGLAAHRAAREAVG